MRTVLYLERSGSDSTLTQHHIPKEPVPYPHSCANLNTRAWNFLHVYLVLDPSWNVMAHGDAREGKWRRNWRMEWVASTLHTTSEHGVSSITTADAHTSAARWRQNRRPQWFKWTRPFRRMTKSGFCTVPSHFKRSQRHWHRWSLGGLYRSATQN